MVTPQLYIVNGDGLGYAIFIGYAGCCFFFSYGFQHGVLL